MKYLRLLCLFLLLVACKKKVEVIKEVPVEKKNSWSEIKEFTGTQKVFLSSGSSANGIYLQQPFFFTELRSTGVNGITTWGASLSTDVDIRIPISSRFFATPYPTNGIVRIASNLQPNASPTGGYYNLKQLDSTATALQTYFLILFKCMAINKNEFLLIPYLNNRPNSPFTFFLFSVKVTRDYPYIDTFFTRQITIPKASVQGYVGNMTALDDYFLVNIYGEGVFKIREDGTFKKVFETRTVDAFYEWQGKVYATVEWNKILVSTDHGETFTEFDGTDAMMTLSSYYVITDSLVGAYHDQLYTLKWSGNNYSTRLLKNDGFETTRINGIERLRDSIYVATTSGLFVKPLNKFFESK